jgi:non-canonical poly(A) RNA polymerase PAPD5/7
MQPVQKEEDVFKLIQVDQQELAKVKALVEEANRQKKNKKKEAKEKKKAQKVETDDFIPFDFDDDDLDLGAEAKKEEEAKGVKKDKDKKKEEPVKPPAKKLKVETLLYKGMPWLKKAFPKGISTVERLHHEIVEFINWMAPTEEERYARKGCIDKVRAVVHKLWDPALVQLDVFGSMSTEFYVPSSDIDLVLTFDEEAVESANVAQPNLRRLAKHLLAAKIPDPKSLQVISRARVPIIKYIDAATGYPVDIALNATSGTESAQLIKEQSASFPALRPLTLLLKQFLDMRGLNEVYTGGLGSYAVTCLVLSFLQIHPLLQANYVRAHENLGLMLMELFELYGRHFNYDAVGVAVRAPNGEHYFEKEARGWLNEARPGLLAMEDPQNEENDIAKGSFSLHQVRQALDHGFEVLQAAMAEFDRLADKNRSADLHQHSILASVIRIDDKTLRHRFYIQQTTNL